MFNSPVGMRSGPTSGQAAAQAGLPHAEVPGDLRTRVERVLADEPAHPDPGVEWSRTTDEAGGRFGLGRFLWPHRCRLAVAFLLVAVETIALQLGPVLTQIGVDDGIVARDRSVLVAAAAAYVVLLAVAAAAGAARTAFTGRLGERLMERLRVRTFEHMQRQQMDFYTTERAGVLLTRMTSDIEALSVLFNEGIVNFAVQGLTLAVITVLLFNYDPLLALITLAAAVPPTLASSMWFRRRAAADYRSVRDRIGDLLGNLQESLAGIRVIAAHDRRDVNVAEHRRVVNRHRDANLRASRANSLYGPGSEAIGIATQAVLLGVGGAMTASGRITVGELAAYLLFLTAFFAPVQALVQLYNSYQQGGAAIAKLRELFSTTPTVTDRPGAEVLAPVRGEIALDGVCFSYGGDRVLHDVSLHVSPGETIALVGETGAGKTTVARLIARLYDPTEGAVRIDGRDLRDVTVTSLRSQIGVVSQEPFLFAGTVRDNVGFARPGAADTELHEALSAVGMSEVVERLGGLDGIVHERGATLSAGERQLLALARTFVSGPRMLVLDEATSNLDLRSEARIEQALDVLLRGRTAVIIAHRLATARRADRIAVVEAGRIVEIGSHRELVASGGRYATMFDMWESHAEGSRAARARDGDGEAP
jgi:ATP-binding cassette subfamily B protein